MKGCGVMPREQINYPTPAVMFTKIDASVDPDSGEVRFAESGEPPMTATGEIVQRSAPTLHVGWHKDTWLQLAIEGDVSYFRFAADNPDGETSERSTVYTEPLTRDEVNKLIRSLRRARDQVFGRDE